MKNLFTAVLFLFMSLARADAAPGGKNKTDMVLIPAGPFLMGSVREDGKVGQTVGVDEFPQRRLSVSAFYIDRFEVTTQSYKKFLDESKRLPPGDPRFPEIYPWAREGGVPEDLADHPIIYISWDDARAYCEWAGKRLPTEAEWEKAARGTDGRIWPWGNIFDPAKANVQEAGIGGTLPVGSFPKGASPFGVQDMAGNVAEWTADWYEAYRGSQLKRNAFGKNKVVKGGAFTLPGEPFARSAHRTLSQEPGKRHRSIGFRCAKDSPKKADPVRP